jgi:porin
MGVGLAVLLAVVCRAAEEDPAAQHAPALPPSLREFENPADEQEPGFEAAAESLFEQRYLTGDWLGWRDRLIAFGIAPTLAYVADIQGNAVGGEVRKVRYAHDIGLDLLFDMNRLADIPGAHFHVSLSSRSGNNLSADIGNVLIVAQACCQVTTRLVNLAWEQSLFEHRLNIRAGRIATGDDFLTSPLYWFFVNNGFDGNPLGVQINVPYFAYPNAVWGTRVRGKPIPEVYVAAGVYDGNEAVTRNSQHGVDFSIRHNDPVLVTAEVGYERNHGRRAEGLPGNYKVGGYYQSGRYRRFDAPPDSNLPRDYEWGNGGYYFLLDQMVYRESGAQGLWPFIVLLFAAGDEISPIPTFLSGGLTYQGLIPGRDDDESLLGIVYAGFSPDLRRSQAGSPAGQQDFELALELSYIIEIGQWLHIQPDLQYIVKPGGTGNIPDALVLGTQVAVNF